MNTLIYFDGKRKRLLIIDCLVLRFSQLFVRKKTGNPTGVVRQTLDVFVVFWENVRNFGRRGMSIRFNGFYFICKEIKKIMFISLDWISDYVDLKGLEVKEIVNRITLATAEVEGIKEIRRFVKGVVIGEVKSVQKLTDKLTFCQVDCGQKMYTTVCGAPNVRVGLKTPFAQVGAVLAGDVKIEESKISGKPSQGILCSAAELGMSGWHEIVLECPDNIESGTPLEKFIPEFDTLIEIDNKSLTHRPDLWGHYGFAREFAAVFRRKLQPLAQLDLTAFDHLPAYPLKNDDYENCPCYGCIEFQTRGTIPSPLFMQRRLHALGMRSYNLLVDVTNYVNWEIGQPTHAFDADKLGGIRVVTMGRNEKFETLDGQTRNLLPEDLLIWGKRPNGEDRPVALAGIMGGLETEVTESTTKLLLESANFKAARIRRTSGRLDLKTDASQRYEKSQPPSNVKTGIARILKLIEEAGANLNVLSRFTIDGDLQNEIRTMSIPADRLEQLAGISLPPEQVLDILHSLGFEAKYQNNKSNETGQSLVVGVPAFRSKKDISIPEDIVEEVLRIFGFDNIPPVMPSQPIKPLFIEKPLKMEHKIRRILAGGHRFLEVHHYVWFNDHWLKTLDFDPGETLVLRNPTSPETTRLRTTLIPNLLALIPKNRPFRDSFRLFEIGRTFHSVGKDRECNEKHHLAGIAFQRSGVLEDFYLSVKSAVEDVLAVCGVQNIRFTDGAAQQQSKLSVNSSWCIPGCWVAVQSGNEYLGNMGVSDKEFMNKICPEGGQAVWFELELDRMNGTLYPEIKFEEPPRYPLSWQDFSLIWSIDRGFEQLEAVLDQFNNPLIVRREMLVSYRGKGLEKGHASYSFRFWIGASDHTLSGEEIESFHKTFLTFLNEHHVALRT
ncbi:MAG: phenylalanine--tRNA ligase subunit beta [Planctomycetaceae bacterium]|nr:phenylalanine--tRNA ligase subunit beta [Planctomycetaceae bacterium]